MSIFVELTLILLKCYGLASNLGNNKITEVYCKTP